MCKFICGMITGALLAGACSVSHAQEAVSPILPAALNQQIDQTNFLVNKGCSGTLIDKVAGYILTANHCVQDQFQDVERSDVQPDGTIKKTLVRISTPGTVSQLVFVGPNEVSRTVFVFRVAAQDPDHDLALLRVLAKLRNTQDTKVACVAPQRLDPVYAIGNPFAVLYSSVSEGIVASTARDYRIIGVDGTGDEPHGDNGLLQHTAPIAPGNSGGALLNASGELVGVNVRGVRGFTVSLAVPLVDIRTFLKANAVVLSKCS